MNSITIESALRISGDDVDPNYISSLLEMPASYSRRKGELHQNGAVAHTGVWIRNYGVYTNMVDATVQVLGQPEFSNRAWEKIGQLHKCELYFGIYVPCVNMGFSVPPEVTEILAERRVHLSLDIYFFQSSGNN